ncbi:MAG: VapC toxin family PIN domain ribonuclease, partial [Verrucomicrobia bacterium]|nr:VapC toxin family PIN domain ribonuclease [Verrucomicrobiota bacterium]
MPKDDWEKIVEILPFETPADIAYGEIRARLEAAGKPIGGNEMLIASQAISLGLTIVTDNEREFSRVEALRFENWFR